MNYKLYSLNSQPLNALAERIDQYSFYFFALFLFLIPFGHLVFDPVLVFWFILRLLVFLLRPEIHLAKYRSFLLLPMLYYLVQWLGLIQTENMQGAYTHLFTSITFLVLPLVFPWTDKRYLSKTRELAAVFTLGVMASILFCLLRAFILSLHFESGQLTFDPMMPNGWEHRFTSSTYSFLTHPSYLAMFSVFGLAFLGFSFDWLRKTVRISLVLYILALVFLILAILLLQSRAGFLALLILMVVLIIRFTRKRRWFILGTLAGMLLLGGSLFMMQSARRYKQFTDFLQHSITQRSLDHEQTYRAGTRILLWKVSGRTIRENWMMGVGLGDVKDELASTYQKLGFEEAAEKRLNAHNQYLQSWLESGIAGFLTLLAMLILPMLYSIKKRDYLALSFLLIISFHLIFESMFSRMDAIGFFVPVYCLFLANTARTPSAYPSRSEG